MEYIVFIFTFFFMEFVAWFTHKYIMHGFLWNLHSDHHTRDNNSIFEKNDSFFLIFATPSFLLILIGTLYSLSIPLAIGVGIAAYGTAYFLVHDVLIHQRIKWFRRSSNFYTKAIRKAHKVHHKKLGKEDGECFGMLLVPLVYFKKNQDQSTSRD